MPIGQKLQVALLGNLADDVLREQLPRQHEGRRFEILGRPGLCSPVDLIGNG